MTAWKGLLHKDFRMGRTWLLTGIFIVVAVNLFIAFRVPSMEKRFGWSLLPVTLHLFYWPVYLYSSLQVEAKQLHQWLHNTQSALRLVTSKLLNGLLAMLISLLISAAYPSYLFYILIREGHILVRDGTSAFSAEWVRFGFTALGSFLWISLSLSLLVLLLWSAYRRLNPYTGKWTWLVTAVGGISLLLLFGKWVHTDLYLWLTQWGFIPYTLPGEANVTPYIGEYLFDFLLNTGLFFLSCRLIEKVEV
ncbi:hypothetical protein [Paludifilum halophilum]|uniref:hypothetical protein n=1 Tax=Paludifilum halophilum TaxID=1642702 RepID=UPI0011404543|nr:hypothetical protein [Paludifilum halophilum]